MIHPVLLAAPRGAGKTTACRRLVELAREAGMRVGGILAPARYDERGNKVGIDVSEVLTGEQHALAMVELNPCFSTVGQYRFDADVMGWALHRVLVALDAPIDVVLIDEVGPLELVRHQGFWPALERLPQAQATTAILVVRAEMLSRLQDYLRTLQPVTITLTMTNRDQVPMRLFDEVWGPVSRRWNEAEQG